MAKTDIGAKHSITETTPQNIMLGSGVVVSGLAFDKSSNKWQYEKVFGATNGGSKLEIKPTFKDLELDGMNVKTKNMTVKTGETATLTTNLAEVTTDNLAMVANGEKATSSDITGFDEVVSKTQVSEKDYIDNLGFIGYTIGGEPIVIKFDYALCTSGLSLEGKNGEQATVEAEFECVAELTSEDLNTLPWHIYRKTVI